ncbi:SNF1-related protein kinase regulatory subunit gamma-like PV42a [Typha latifolia]|uniref:SNF1-related protein kinase regulatory subunit gamma-like PV42a n=1 Tax=Typha latifolia TaxID=4733 RepID=UPI003C2F9AF6
MQLLLPPRTPLFSLIPILSNLPLLLPRHLHRSVPRQEEEMETPLNTARGGGRAKKTRHGPYGWLRDRRIRDLIRDKRRLVEVPYTASLAHAVNALLANHVVAVPVAAPPGHWIGAGGSMILESDPATGAVRKHYIGMLTMLDVLVHIAEEKGVEEAKEKEDVDLDARMAVPVSSVIGHSLEGLSLWTLNPQTSILDCMEAFSKGVHRALVPVESQADHVITAELVEASPGYRMLTQMDVLSFLRENSHELKDIIPYSVQELGAINVNVFAVTKYTKVIEVIKFMRAASLNAVPVVEAPEDGQLLLDGKGKKLVETFSATDLRGCPIALMQSWLSVSVTEFKDMVLERASEDSVGSGYTNPREKKLVTCFKETSLSVVIEKAVANHVHRVWVVDHQGLILGLIALTDILRVIRESALMLDNELQNMVPQESS